MDQISRKRMMEQTQKINETLDEEFLRFTKKRNSGQPSPDNFVVEWNQKLESTGIILLNKPSKKENVFANPAGGWLRINPEVALKILVFGMP